MKNYLWLVALLPLLSGCESQAILVKKDDAYFAPPKTEAPPPADGRAGGVFETGYNWSLTADRRAYRVGDILTVILEESTGNDSNLLIVFYVQIMPDDFVMQLHRF
ncbi:hypothetical protein MZ16F92_24570 [Escherichia coli]